MITVGEWFNLGAMNKSGRKGRGHGVILNANGQVIAHVFGQAKVVDPSFRFVPRHLWKDAGASTPTPMAGDEDQGVF